MEKKLVLNEKQQMVDLNEDLVNFRLNLKVTPQKKGEYQAASVKQTDLDSGNVNYQTFSKPFAAKIENTDNVYQNHFLCLKSNTNQECLIQVERQALERTPDPEPEPQFAAPVEQQPPQMQMPVTKSTSGIFSMKNIILMLVVLGIGVGIYFMWFSGGAKSKNSCTVTEMPASKPVGSPDTSGLLNKLQELTK